MAIFGVVLDVSLIAVLVSGLVALNLKYRNSNVLVELLLNLTLWPFLIMLCLSHFSSTSFRLPMPVHFCVNT